MLIYLRLHNAPVSNIAERYFKDSSSNSKWGAEPMQRQCRALSCVDYTEHAFRDKGRVTVALKPNQWAALSIKKVSIMTILRSHLPLLGGV